MAAAKGALQAEAQRTSDPAELLFNTNEVLAKNFDRAELFATALLVRVAEGGREWSYAGAGHPPALRFCSDGRLEALDSSGTALGMFPNASYETRNFTMDVADRLLMFTDGLIEARRIITRFCLGFGLALGVFLILIATPLTGLFSNSEAIQTVATQYLWIVAISYGAYGLVMSVNASFNGMGRPLPGVVISTCRVIVVFLPLALVGKHYFDLPGLFAATTLSNLLIAAAGFAWLGAYINQAKSRSAGPRS